MHRAGGIDIMDVEFGNPGQRQIGRGGGRRCDAHSASGKWWCWMSFKALVLVGPVSMVISLQMDERVSLIKR